eukprot:gene8052-10910_t
MTTFGFRLTNSIRRANTHSQSMISSVTRDCVACDYVLEREDFSQNQWRKGVRYSCCTECGAEDIRCDVDRFNPTRRNNATKIDVLTFSVYQMPEELRNTVIIVITEVVEGLSSNYVPNGKLGRADLGLNGIKTFFHHHKCNQFCRSSWAKPRGQGNYY